MAPFSRAFRSSFGTTRPDTDGRRASTRNIQDIGWKRAASTRVDQSGGVIAELLEKGAAIELVKPGYRKSRGHLEDTRVQLVTALPRSQQRHWLQDRTRRLEDSHKCQLKIVPVIPASRYP